MNLTKQGWDIVGGLIEDEVELSISLIHLVSFQQTETGSSQQMVLRNLYTSNKTSLEP